MATYCATCTNPRETDCLYCIKGNRYEGPDAIITHSVVLFPTVTVRRHVEFHTVTKGSEDTDLLSPFPSVSE